MVDRVLTAWAEQRALPRNGDAVVDRRTDGWTLSYAYFSEFSGWGVSASIDSSVWNKDLQKQLKKAVKGVGMLAYNPHGAVSIILYNVKKHPEKLDEAGRFLLETLSSYGIQPATACHFCKQTNCDDIMVDKRIGYPSHTVCKQEQARTILAEVERNESGGNYVLGILCAIVGGLVGCIPTFITVYFFSLISGWLCILIPVASYYGYKLGKGILKPFVPFLIAVISLACTIATVLMSEYMNFLEYFPNRMFGDFMEELLSLDLADIVRVFTMPVLFCIFGIVFAWGSISRTNKQRIDAARQIMGQDGGQ